MAGVLLVRTALSGQNGGGGVCPRVVIGEDVGFTGRNVSEALLDCAAVA
jgi:hypothetical protein